MTVTSILKSPANTTMIFGIVSFIASLIYLSNEAYFSLVAGLSAALIVLPKFIEAMQEYQEARTMEKYLPDFLREVAEAHKAGMPLPKAIATAAEGNYGPLTKQMRIVASQVSWGMSFDTALLRLTKRTSSRLIKQTMRVIVESYRAGGDVASILETVSEDIRSLKQTESERKEKFSANVAVTYVIFFLFLGILIGLANFLIPQMTQFSAFAPAIGGESSPPTEAEYKVFFLHLILISAFFSGMVAGFMSENSFLAGLRHSFVLMIITILLRQVFLNPAPLTQQLGKEISTVPPSGIQKLQLGGATAEKVEPRYKTYVLTKDITTDQIVNSVNEEIEKGITFFEKPITSSRIQFRQEKCLACERGDITVRKHRVIVGVPTKIAYKVEQEGETFIVLIRDTPAEMNETEGA